LSRRSRRFSSLNCGAAARGASPHAPYALLRLVPRLILLLGLLLLSGACASARRGAPAVPGPRAEAAPPWELPADAFGTQYLFRISFAGPAGEGSLRVTLRLAAQDRYQVQAVDALGRSFFSLDAVGDQGLAIDHRGRTFCRFAGAVPIASLPLGPFPLVALPPLLLGRVPARPAASGPGTGAGAEPVRTGDALSFRDAAGRRWTARLDGGRVVAWTLWSDGDPALIWLEREGWAVLSDRERGIQMRWKEILREPLHGPPAPLSPPSGYRAAACGAADPAGSGDRTPRPAARPI
jgi:hypothetical protein